MVHNFTTTKFEGWLYDDSVYLETINFVLIHPAADTLDAVGVYLRNPSADYPPPVQYFNPIMNMVITGTTRAICYNQIIYDDIRVEEDEFFSLTLIVQDGSALKTTVHSQLSSTFVWILDDDGALFPVH